MHIYDHGRREKDADLIFGLSALSDVLVFSAVEQREPFKLFKSAYSRQSSSNLLVSKDSHMHNFSFLKNDTSPQRWIFKLIKSISCKLLFPDMELWESLPNYRHQNVRET